MIEFKKFSCNLNRSGYHQLSGSSTGVTKSEEVSLRLPLVASNTGRTIVQRVGWAKAKRRPINALELTRTMGLTAPSYISAGCHC